MSNTTAAAVWGIMLVLVAGWILIVHGVIRVSLPNRNEPFPQEHKDLMIDAIEHAGLTSYGDLRSVDDIADDILTILAGQGWRLIHD